MDSTTRCNGVCGCGILDTIGVLSVFVLVIVRYRMQCRIIMVCRNRIAIDHEISSSVSSPSGVLTSGRILQDGPV